MSFAKQFNKVTFSVDTTGFEYCKLKDLYDEKNKDLVFNLNGLFVNKSPLGLSPCFICAELGKLVNVPSHMAEVCQRILQDSEAIQSIESGKVGFSIYTYNARGKDCFGVRFVDL